MSNSIDYTTYSPEELLKEEKKLKQEELVRAVFIGFCIGIMIFGNVTAGFGFIYTFIPLLLIGLISRGAKTRREQLNRLREEIKLRKIR
jgi:hypothetical protein